jgi:serine/threonine protein kinase
MPHPPKDNFFLQFDYQVRLSDFGLAKIAYKDNGSRFSRNADEYGTIRFMSPELFVTLNNTGNITVRSLSSDIWALASTFYVASRSNSFVRIKLSRF